MERQYHLALERIQELEEKYMDLKEEYELLKDGIKFAREYLSNTLNFIEDELL